MTVSKLLIANRGEVAVRIIRSASELGITTVAIYSEDDRDALHVRLADEARALNGAGAAPYLDIGRVVAAGVAAGCDAVHPGWGFLSENARFAAACEVAGLTFVGPAPAALTALGDKTTARQLAQQAGVPTLRGTSAATTLDEAREFFDQLADGGSMVIKAVAGGGGRGMRVVTSAAEIEPLYKRCQSEALRAFGSGDVFVEERMYPARHIEIQVVADGSGGITHLWERDCSIQRRHQKLIEIAPSPMLSAALREQLAADAVRLAASTGYRGLGTFEFLVGADTATDSGGRYAFIEANPRLQVEHTITEEVFGVDLVKVQLRIAAGSTLADLGLDAPAIPRGTAMQLRINSETIGLDAVVRPSTGTLERFEPPSGIGVRVDTAAFAGQQLSPAFDSLLAKVIVHTSSGAFSETTARAIRALREFTIDGVQTNIAFLQSIINHHLFQRSEVTTTFVDDHIGELVPLALQAPQGSSPSVHQRETPPRTGDSAGAPSGHTAGARVDAADPLAVLDYGQRQRPQSASAAHPHETAAGAVVAPMQSTIISFEVQVGDVVRAGQEVAVVNAMKMEHVLTAPIGGTVLRLNAAPGDAVVEGQLLVAIEPSRSDETRESEVQQHDLDAARPDLDEILARHEMALDPFRPAAVERRHASGHRTTRENIEDLIDAGSWLEYGPLVLANDPRLSKEDLILKSAADGMITGIGSVNGAHFAEPHNQCMVIAYDYMVMAGTQGARNHWKTDRAISVAKSARMPVVLFSEGGGGRASAGGGAAGSAGSVRTFANFGTLSGLVPIIGINTGRCFAGNASLLGCCDVIIATRDSNIGMGGPAMVEGGGLGVFAPEEIGPMDIQVANGVVDVLVDDDAEAVRVGRQYLSYFQGRMPSWEAPDQRALRHVVPENRLRTYDIRAAMRTMADAGSYLELRRGFGEGMVTAFIRVEGRPIGVFANDPNYFGGAITSPGSDKAARFMQLCDAFDIPVLALCDTPGMMVGPEIEKTALVRHCSRLFVIGANLTVPYLTVVTRKAYGLGAIAMAAGSFKEPLFTVSWPTGEFGGMGLEGQVKLGYRKELMAIADLDERRRWFDEMVAKAYERGKALNEAVIFGVDDTIDPADTRRWISTALAAYRPEPRTGRKRPGIDAW